MKAFIVDCYQSDSALRLGEMPEPEVRDEDVLVAIHAASLNQASASDGRPSGTASATRLFSGRVKGKVVINLR